MLNWQPGESKYYQQAGAYKVAAGRVHGKWRYLPYFRKEIIGDSTSDVEEARQACEKHAIEWQKTWGSK